MKISSITKLALIGLAAAAATGAAGQYGPTLQLSYTPEQLNNPVDVFMYFVPLASLTAVQAEVQPDTDFTSGITGWQHSSRRDRFTLKCDFEVSGEGEYRVVYDPGEMIAFVSKGETSQRRLTNLLDWIKFDGPCLGSIEVAGSVSDGETIVEEVTISFNRDRRRSPVTIALYDIPRKNDRYDYHNRQNDTVARVNTLTFRRSENSPRMSVEIASVQRSGQSEGLFSSLTAVFANLLLSAQPISEVGNDTMLEFGQALYERQSAFTFPVAQTLKPALDGAQARAF